MEKQYKPVPDVEALRYKGTPDKPDIKIFVSHRIDLDSEIIDNPLYIPVRCGAVYDEREGITMLGDDTGDNISEKRMSFCELTVQYWAWKNVKADYYGLCHYRRFLSFSDTQYEKVDSYNNIIEHTFSDDFISKFGLDLENVQDKIQGFDIISLVPMKLNELEHMRNVTVYDSLKNNPVVFPIDAVNQFVAILKSKYPDLSQDIDAYLNGFVWRAFNCYILKKEYFFEYCEMLYDVLFELEKQIDLTKYNQEQYRIIGYMGEVMFAVYYNYIGRTKNVRTTELQLVRVEYTDKYSEIYPAFSRNNIPVLMASSNEYVPFLSVLLQSIKVNSSADYNYDITVISKGIREHNKKILRNMLSTHKNFSLRFVHAEVYLSGRNFHTAMHITPMTYLRLAMLDILKNYDKAIYLDCDVVVNSDIAELYNTNLDGKYIGAAVDTVMAGWCNFEGNPQIEYNKNILGLKHEFQYFNAGIIVVNLAEFRKDYTTRQLMDMAASKAWKWFDQDVLNIVCEGKVQFLSNKWNVMSHLHDIDSQLPEFLAPLFIFKGYKDALENPKAIHYAGRFIPCFVPQVDLAEYFWQYARISPYYELILSAMVSNQIGIATSSGAVTDTRTGARKLADKILPKGTRRRAFAKILLPKGSMRWRFCKQIYYIFKPEYRPAKQ